MGLLQKIEKEQIRKQRNFETGDKVRVHVRIKEGDKERIQVFEGTVIAIRGSGVSRNFTVRKISYGVGVERVFPLNAPTVEKVEVISSGKVRRAKLYYLRERQGKAARLRERDTRNMGTGELAPEEEAEVAEEAPQAEAEGEVPAGEETASQEAPIDEATEATEEDSPSEATEAKDEETK